MIIAVHIAFFYHEKNNDITRNLENRSKYILDIINNYYSKWENCIIDIFIHTNNNIVTKIKDMFLLPDFIKVAFITHNVTNEHPFSLTWKHRKLMETQKDDYDVFIYSEDDIAIPYKAFQYWQKYKDICEKLCIDLGFVLVEVDEHKEKFCSNILIPCTGLFNISDRFFTWNHQNYAAFWICDKDILSKFMKSPYWDEHCYFPRGHENPPSTHLAESAAIGYKMSYTGFHRGSFYPLDDEKRYILEDCFVYHLANNYVNSSNVLGSFAVKRMTEDILCNLT